MNKFDDERVKDQPQAFAELSYAGRLRHPALTTTRLGSQRRGGGKPRYQEKGGPFAKGSGLPERLNFVPDVPPTEPMRSRRMHGR